MEILAAWWPLILVGVLFLLTRLDRGRESKKAKGTEDALKALLGSMHEDEHPPTVSKAMGKLASKESLGALERALLKVAADSLEEEETQVIRAADGEHELDVLSRAAKKAETKRAKVLRGAKKVGAFALKAARELI